MVIVLLTIDALKNFGGMPYAIMIHTDIIKTFQSH